MVEPAPTPSPTPTPAATPAEAEPPTSLLQTPTAAPEWKEFEPDPTKSAEENAAAKTAHDATKPAPKAEDFKPYDASAIKFPEGVKVDDALVDGFLTIANKHKFSQEAVQEIADLQIKSVQTARESDSKAWNDEQVRRQEEVRSDAKVGGANLSTSVDTANKILQQYGSPELAQEIADSGLGNSLRFFRFIQSISPKLLEAAPIPAGSAASAAGKTQAEILFPNQGQAK